MPSINDVTIIIPSYCPTKEHVGWLAEAIDSAIQQECKVIVVDDASPLKDKVREVLHARKDKLDKALIMSEHRGVSTTRNAAAAITSTQLLYPLDGDDTLLPGTIEQLLSIWHEVPVYSDLQKFNASKSVDYPLLDFSCELVYQKIGIASVNVLHSHEQHKNIGGWDTDLDFYEDGEYNARLMLCYKAVRFPKPLVRYRQHPHQRTKTYKTQHEKYKKIVFDKIRRYNMAGCPGGCGGKKRNLQTGAQAMSTQQRSAAQQAQVAKLPGEDGTGRVLVRYIGGNGRGKHYYKGKFTNFRYPVKHNDVFYADPRDAIEPGEHVGVNTSLLVKINQDNKPTTVVETIVVEREKKERKPRLDKEKNPVEPTEVEEPEDDAIEITTWPQNKVLRALDDVDDLEYAEQLLEMEEETRNRKKVVAKLEGIIESLSEGFAQ